MKINVLIGLIETTNWAKKRMFCALFDLGSIPDYDLIFLNTSRLFENKRNLLLIFKNHNFYDTY